MGANLMDLWGYRHVTDSDGKYVFVMENYELYDVSYNVLSDRVHQVFTDSCLDATNYAVKFIDYDGSVAVDSWMEDELVKGTVAQIMEDYPDTYRFISRTEDTVEFTLISHYDHNGWDYGRSEGEPTLVCTIEYPIRMVNTDDG